jgi:hypothetical protein
MTEGSLRDNIVGSAMLAALGSVLAASSTIAIFHSLIIDPSPGRWSTSYAVAAAEPRFEPFSLAGPIRPCRLLKTFGRFRGIRRKTLNMLE